MESIINAMNIRISALWMRTRQDADQWSAGASHWRVTITHNDAQMSVNYSMGSALKGPPAPCDVLDCILSDAESVQESFDDWCDTFGYDTDSRKAERMYQECKRTADDLSRLFSSDELDALRGLFN